MPKNGKSEMRSDRQIRQRVRAFHDLVTAWRATHTSRLLLWFSVWCRARQRKNVVGLGFRKMAVIN